MNLAVVAYASRTIFVHGNLLGQVRKRILGIRPECLRPYIPESRSGGELQGRASSWAAG